MPEYIESKSILSKLKDAPDPYFGISYNMNLYRGCQHQCIYCDSRSKVYGIDDFSKIRVKKNATSLLEKTLTRRLKKAVIGTGSMNDPYMPVEKDEKLTRSALEIIARHNFPVHIITKGDLVVRDIDIIGEISKIYAAVSFTITTADDKLSKTIEPGAPATSDRFKALKKLSLAGIYCGVILTPVLPFITDSEENIRAIIHRSYESGASYVIAWMGTTQREGQREYFYKKLDSHFPGLKNQYTSRFGNAYNCPSPNSNYLYRIFQEQTNLYKLSIRMKFFQENLPGQLSLFP
jgi:DNA repair photolyase